MITIQPTKNFLKFNLKELIEYRDLLMLLVKRDLTVIYKQTILGPLWFLIQPLITTVVFTIIFGKVANISTDGLPHILFYMSGIVIWNYAQGVMNTAGNSLASNSTMLSKVYFPRLIIPLSGVVSNLVYLGLNALMFLGFYFYYYFTQAGVQSFGPVWALCAFPLLIIYTAAVGLGIGLWIAAITTKYRDFRFMLPFIVQVWMYATPIIYPASIVANPTYRVLLWLNPISVAVEMNRYMFTGLTSLNATAILIGCVSTVIIFFSGLALFNKVQRNFVDVI
jgi:lipopolysaccharide transport system permease protein